VAAPGVPAEIVVARETGALWGRVFVYIFPAVAGFGGVLGGTLVLALPGLSYWVIPGLGAVAAGLAAVQATTELSAYALEVRIGPRGLALTYSKFAIEAPWAEWHPVARRRLTGGIALRTSEGRSAGYLVTAGQARRIRDFPGRPKWTEGEELFGPTGSAPSHGAPA
jgi:hypothetical protein